MKKTSIVCFLILMISVLGHGEKIGSLMEVNRPGMIQVDGTNLYITDGANILIYDLKSLKLQTKFGKIGEGPGELMMNDAFSLQIVRLPEELLAFGINKAILFGLTGDFIREFRVPFGIFYIYPLTEGYIGMQMKNLEDRQPQLTMNIYDKDLTITKEIYAQDLSGAQNQINLTFDGINFAIHREKIYIEKSPKGFEIGVYDLSGNSLYEIRKEYPKVKFNRQYENAAIERIKNDPQIRAAGWENIKDAIKMTHSDYIPLIQDMFVSDNRILVRSCRVKPGQEEYIVLDLKGNELKRMFLQTTIKARIGDELMGRSAKLYTMHNNIFYYILENDETEDWELHAVSID